MRKFLKALVVAVGVVFALVASIGVAYVIAPLPVFNALMLKDAGAKLVDRHIAYGTHPRQRYALFAPEQGTNFPLLVFVQGGAWQFADKEGYDFVGHAFASKGYLTAIIDYRLVPEVRYPSFVEDTAKAVAHLRLEASKFGGDASRVYLVGHSAGAYNVVHAMLNPAFAAEMQNIKAAAALSGPYDFIPLVDERTIAAFGGFSPIESTQPASYLRLDQPPILLLHGADDEIVPVSSSMVFHDKLLAARARCAIKIHANTNHISILGDLSRPFRYRSTTFADITSFFDQHP